MKAEGKTHLKLRDCEYRVEKGDLDYSGRFVLDKPTKISGQGCGMTTLVEFGRLIKGKKSEGIVEIEDLTIKGAERSGLCAYEGMKVIMRGCTIEECGCSGVLAFGADITCDDLQVIGCGKSGVFASVNATITLSGQDTSIQGNVTKGESYSYGQAYGLRQVSSSFIHLVHPLTKEQISKENDGGRNWGGRGTIKQVSK
jgi:hypothetical protein